MTSTVPHQALYRRWRAQTFGEIVGQEAVVETLRNAVRTDRVSHAVLFVGPRGTGKTSLARILAKAVNCTNLQDGDACDTCPSCISIREGTTLDLVEIDAASNRGIDDVRGLRERLAYPPGQLKRKIYILDEAHQITGPAWNALLKSIEEPPDFVIFMFASTEPSAFPAAILSRLQRYDVRRLTVAEIEGKLARILAADARDADPAAIRLIARLAAGGMRDAESMLDQLLSGAPGRIDEARVRDLLGLADAEVVEAFVDDLVRGDGAAGVVLLDSLEERGRDLRALLDQAVEVIRAELIAGLADPTATRHDQAALVAAARRLAAIDPNRAGIGGLRFGLELAMFGADPGSPDMRAQAAPGTTPSAPTIPAPASTSVGARATVGQPAAVVTPADGASTQARTAATTDAPDTPPPRQPAARPAPAPRPTAEAASQEPAAASPTTGTPPATGTPPTPAAPRTAAAPAAPAAAPTTATPSTTGAPPTTATPSTTGAPPTTATPSTTGAPPTTATPSTTGAPPTTATPSTTGAPPTTATPPTRSATPTTGTPAAPALTPDVESGSDLARLRDGWSEVVASVGPSTRAVITECRPLGVDGNIVTLGFPESKGFLKDVAERKRPELEQAFGRFFGRAVSVRSVATNLELPPAASDDLVAEARRIFAEELADVGEVS